MMVLSALCIHAILVTLWLQSFGIYNIYIYIYIYIYMYIYIYICMYIYMYVYIYVYIYVYTAVAEKVVRWKYN